jgi:hypothetical protein
MVLHGEGWPRRQVRANRGCHRKFISAILWQTVCRFCFFSQSGSLTMIRRGCVQENSDHLRRLREKLRRDTRDSFQLLQNFWDNPICSINHDEANPALSLFGSSTRPRSSSGISMETCSRSSVTPRLQDSWRRHSSACHPFGRLILDYRRVVSAGPGMRPALCRQ